MENRFICKSCGQKRNLSCLYKIGKSKNGFGVWLCKDLCTDSFKRQLIINKWKN